MHTLSKPKQETTMTMYVLVGRFWFEGTEVLGVYETVPDALAARDRYVARCDADTDFSMTDFDDYDVYPFVVGAEATTDSVREEV